MNQHELQERYFRVRDMAYYWGSLITVAALVLVAGCSSVAFAQGDAAGPAADPTVQQVLELFKLAGGAVRAGEYFVAALALIIALVFALRLGGKKLHELIPDDSVFDKPLFFLFDSKPGGVLLNGFTAAGLLLVGPLLAGAKLTPVLAGATVLGGIGASQVYGWVKDFMQYLRERKGLQAATAGAAAAAKVDSGPAAVDVINKP